VRGVGVEDEATGTRETSGLAMRPSTLEQNGNVEESPAPVAPGGFPPPLWLVLSAFAALYLVWGSTYLGIRLAIDSMPPFLMAGSRFVVAGGLMYAVIRMRGATKPTGRQWLGATITGGLLIAAGNGGVTWAEQLVPTGVTALIIATVPAWIALADWARPGGTRPGALAFVGIALGFTGVALLVSGKAAPGHVAIDPIGAAALVGSTICWAAGSIYSRHAEKPASPLLTIGMQMLVGGIMQVLIGLLMGEGGKFSLEKITAVSAWAWVYLTTVGSLVGFTAYVWLLQVSTPAKVSTYAYVNPLIAVLLGNVVLKEVIPPGLAMSGALILGAVVLLTLKRGSAGAAKPAGARE
jgi:drug/metabolite transporter (DMT)-like permease